MLKFENGVYDIPNDVYHNSSGISRSGLWTLKRSPHHYWDAYLNPNREPKASTPAMKMGELTHALVLEPNEFDKRYIVEPEYEKLPIAVLLKNVGKWEYSLYKDAKEAAQERNEIIKDDFMTQAEGKEIITQSMYNEVKALADSVWRNEVSHALFKDIKAEQSIYFTHEATGLQVKVRPDAWMGSVVTDLKTCVDASYKAFERAAFSSGYYLQAAMISEALKSIGIRMEKFVFFCVEKTSPLATVYYMLDDDALEYGLEQFNQLMNTYAWCVNNNSWESYESQHLYLPRYAKYED